ncbi:MAG: histidine kinase [Opitutaceae bacterium]|nr:histidine kinase [Opitutaceae bacterium]
MNDTSACPERQDKLYVLAQVVGWGGFTLVCMGLALLNRGITLRWACVCVGSNAIGWLLSHLFRLWIHRRGWKHLNWSALLPRVLVAVVLLSSLWAVLDWPFYQLTVSDAEKMQISELVRFIYGVFNGVWILLLWSLLYFGYNIADRFRRLEIERVHLQATVKEAELRALKSQVNPHFIFNALNSVRALIDEDPTRARQSVTQLANLLRYSLQSGQLETVPLEDELRVVNDYLALEQVRHEERLRLRVDVDPAARQFSLPPMLLQTLVENAVKYGIAKLPEGGEVAIIARCEGDDLVLRVTNPGTLPDVHTETPVGTGLGLRNAAERLRLLGGERASLQLRAENANLVVAEARIPQIAIRASELIPA